MRSWRIVAFGLLVVAVDACGTRNPTRPSSESVASAGTSASAGVSGSTSNGNGVAWGPETPPFNIESVLRPVGDGDGFGLIKFRQPNDGLRRIYLTTWVRDLAANTEYRLQRAVDTVLDGICSSDQWLTLGQGLTPQTLLTDDRGTGRQEFYRDLPANLALQKFDIHFRIVTLTGAEVLHTSCYQFVAEPD
jgi:hypothetical protein